MNFLKQFTAKAIHPRVHVCKIATARIDYQQQRDEHVCNVTIKSAPGFLRTFAPTWEMVMSYKQGSMSWQTYQKSYYALMRERFRLHEYHFKELLHRDEIVLCCYCPDSSRHTRRCHRYLLTDILLKLGPHYGIDAISVGEYHNPDKRRARRKY